MARSSRSASAPFVFLTLLLDIVGMSLLIPIMPRLVASFVGGDLAVAAHYSGPLLALYTLTQFLAAPLLGALSDRFGRKPLILASLVGTMVAYLLMAWAPSLAWLFGARILAGLAGASMSVAAAYIADISTDENRARNFGMLGAAYGLGFIVGPLLGGALAAFGLKVPFFAAATVAALNFGYGLLFVPESQKPEHRRPFRWERANPWSFVATLRRSPVVQGVAVVLLLVGLAQQCQQSTWVLMTALKFHWSPVMTGASLALAGLGMAVVQGALLGVLMPRLGERRAILYGLAGFTVSMALMGLVNDPLAFMGIIALSSFAAVAGPATQGLLARQVGPEEQGALQGALASLTSLTGIVGPVFANQLFARFSTGETPLPGIAFLAGAAILVVAFVLMRRLLDRLPQAAVPEVRAERVS